MPKLRRSKILPFASETLYQLVMDVESYPEFLPWCKEVSVIERNNDVIIADMTIKFNIISLQYRSHITSGKDEEGNFYIYIKSISGPFEYLTHNWDFLMIDQNNSNISFDIDFKLSSSILGNMLDAIFENSANKIISSFEKRAYKILG